MHGAPIIALGISTICFGWYGAGCFVSQRLKAEFVRYRLARLRGLIGFLQIGASLGLLLGLQFRPLLLVSSGGLTLMMLLAVATRFRIRDPLYRALPALALCWLNLYIFLRALSPRAF